MTPHQLQTVLPILIAIPILALVMWRNARGRRLRVETLWIFPTILVVMTGLALSHIGPLRTGLIETMVTSFAAGGGLGWFRGKMMRITIDPESHTLTSKASPVAIIFILALFALRYAARIVLGENVTALHMTLEQLSDVFLVFLIGLLTVARVEMWIRASRLLTEARAAKAGA